MLPSFFIPSTHLTRVTVNDTFGVVIFLYKINPACHNDANGIKTGSNSKMTDKHVAECSKAAYLGVN